MTEYLFARTGDISGITAGLADHIADATAAHAASAIAVTPSGTLAATDVAAALVELLGDIETHVADASAAHAASAISFSATGSIAATDVQTAIAEVATDYLAAIAALSTVYQPLDADLTSWAAITRAAGFDTFVATPSLANFGSLLTDEAAGLITFMTTPSSANLAALVTDETGSGLLVFATAPTLTSIVITSNAATFPNGWGNTLKLTAADYPAIWFNGVDQDIGVVYAFDSSTNVFWLEEVTAGVAAGDELFWDFTNQTYYTGSSTWDLGNSTKPWDRLYVNSIELGHATANTLTASGGTLSIEGVAILTALTGQPLDADLTAIAALTTTAYGRSLLELADETALEALLDTLPNLVSVQGRTVTLADAGANAFFGWDDVAGAYENLTAAEALAIILTVDGAGSGLDADLLDGQSSAFYATASSLSDHLTDAVDAHDASAISSVAAGGLSSTDVQSALNELDTEKQPIDADLTAIAALTTTAYGRSLLELADETALEALLDTLPNLVSIQGLTVTLADAGADAFFGWDDSAGAYENLTASEALEIIKTVDGAGSGLDADLLDGKTTGTSGNTVPLLDGANTWSALQTFTAGIVMTGTLGLNIAVTAASIASDPASGYFGTFEAFSGTKIQLTQSEVQAADESGGWRSALSLYHQDSDATDYEAIAYRTISDGMRVGVFGPNDGLGTYSTSSKDFHGVTSQVIARTDWTVRGVAAFAGDAVQFGEGVALNELTMSNPSASNAQASQIAGWLITLSGKKAAADASHTVHGHTIINIGKKATAVLEAYSAGTDGDNGQFGYVLKLDNATVDTGAILMPASAATDVGTRIIYESGSWSAYDRSGNAFTWALGSANVIALDGATFFPAGDGGASLGYATLAWQNLFLNTGAVINFENGDVTVTHSSNRLSIAGAAAISHEYSGDFPLMIVERTDTHGSAAVVGAYQFYGRDAGGASQFYGSFYMEATDATAGSEDATFAWLAVKGGSGTSLMNLTGTALNPATSGLLTLGTATLMWSDLFLKLGGSINFNNGDVVLTHAADLLTLSAGNMRIYNGGVGPHFDVLVEDGTNYPDISSTGYGAGGGGTFHVRRANGNVAGPTQVLSGNNLGGFGARSYTSAGSFQSSSSSAIHFFAAEDQSATNQGSYMTILTTPIGSTSASRVTRFAWTQDGTSIAYGSGTHNPNATIQTKPNSDVVLLAAASGAAASSAVVAYGANSGFRGFRAGGTAASPTATQANDLISYIGASGYQTTTGAWATASNALIGMYAAENFTSTAQGTLIIFETTTATTTTRVERLRLDQNGRATFAGTTSKVLETAASRQPWVQMHGTTLDAGYGASHWAADAVAPSFVFTKSRGGVGTHTVVANDDFMGAIRWNASDGTGFIPGAAIAAVVTGTPGTNDMPTSMRFYTTSDGASTLTERMRIGADNTIWLIDSSLYFTVSGDVPLINFDSNDYWAFDRSDNAWTWIIGGNNLLALSTTGLNINASQVATANNWLKVDQGAALTTGTNTTYAFAIVQTGTHIFTVGSGGGATYMQSWNAQPFHVNGQGNDLFLAEGADGVQCGAPTGGDKGNGTINAKAVYDDNTLLTCIPVQKEFLDNGTIDKAYWNSKTPEPPKKFDTKSTFTPVFDKETGAITGYNETLEKTELPVEPMVHPSIKIMEDLMAAGYDPRNPAKYCDYLYENNSLPGMPTRANWVHNELSQGQIMTRLWLAAELLAVSYRTSHQDLEALKNEVALLKAKG